MAGNVTEKPWGTSRLLFADASVRLVVSLWSLRRHYGGAVTVYTTQPDSHEVGRRCAADPRLRIEHRTFPAVPGRRNSAFLTKLALLTHTPYEVTAYLDADTLVVGDVSRLLDVKPSEPFCATQFSDWLSTHRTVRRRIQRWARLQAAGRDPAWLSQLLSDAVRPRPAVNGGVFSYRRDADILKPWQELAHIGRETFICDEIALQLLLSRHAHRVLDCRYNCSPVYAGHRRDVRIWHFHGGKHVRRPRARAIWLPVCRECLRENVAGVAEWGPAGDRRLAGYLKPREAVP